MKLGALRKAIPAGARSAISGEILRLFSKSKYAVNLGSFSQAGEDRILSFLFRDKGVPLSQVTYLDLGARHPVFGSNTYLFYCAGARGVCVDADYTFIPLLRKTRPRDTILNVAVTDSEAETGTFYFIEGGGSTTDRAEAGRRSNQGLATQSAKSVPFVHINRLIEENFADCPMLLSIDIEGVDLPVLRALDFDAHPIPAICVETCAFSTTHVRPKETQIQELLRTKGYSVYADTYVNTILVNDRWFAAPAGPN